MKEKVLLFKCIVAVRRAKRIITPEIRNQPTGKGIVHWRVSEPKVLGCSVSRMMRWLDWETPSLHVRFGVAKEPSTEYYLVPEFRQNVREGIYIRDVSIDIMDELTGKATLNIRWTSQLEEMGDTICVDAFIKRRFNSNFSYQRGLFRWVGLPGFVKAAAFSASAYEYDKQRDLFADNIM